MSFEFGYRPEELRQLKNQPDHVLQEISAQHNIEFIGRTVMAELYIIMDVCGLHRDEALNTQLFWTIWILAFYALSLATISYKKRRQVANILQMKAGSM